MKKGLLAMLFAVALVVPALAENMWVGGSLGYEYSKVKDADSVTSWTIEPEFGYSVDESWDIGIDLGYSSQEGVEEYMGTTIPNDKVKTFEIAPFARYKLFAIGDFNVLAKGKLFYNSAKFDEADITITSYGIAIAPVITYSINETWSIGCTLNFAEIGFSHSKADDSDDTEIDQFGFNVNDGEIISVGFSYHF